MVNYQKLDFLAEIGATKTLNKLLQQEPNQNKLFKLKNAAKLFDILIEKKCFDTSLLPELLKLEDNALIEKYLRIYRERNPLHQCLIIETCKPEITNLLFKRNELSVNAQTKLLSQNNEELISAYIEYRIFDRERTIIFFKQATPAQMIRYIHLYNRSINPYRKEIEPLIFATGNPEVITEYCANLTIANKESITKLLALKREDILLSYLEMNALYCDAAIHWLAETGDKTTLEYLIFQKRVRVAKQVINHLFVFEDAPRWIKQYISYAQLPEEVEAHLFEPQYRTLLRPYIDKNALRSNAAQELLFKDEDKTLLRLFIEKYPLHNQVQLQLFGLDDNQELLKFYIKKHGLSSAAERHLFRGEDRELKLYYLAQIGEDK